MVDDCHATGFMGPQGRGTPAHFGVRADILTGTLGKALGGALGGYVAGPQPVIDLLRQRARPYLFSNACRLRSPGRRWPRSTSSKGPTTCARGCLPMPPTGARGWRMLGFDLLPGEHPIVPVMLGDARLAQAMAAAIWTRGRACGGVLLSGRAAGGAHPHADERGADPR
jgi:glycine C-acetyltransferase